MKFNSFNLPLTILYVFRPKAENVKQQLTMGTRHMMLCTGKYMWLIFLCNSDTVYNFYISDFY